MILKRLVKSRHYQNGLHRLIPTKYWVVFSIFNLLKRLGGNKKGTVFRHELKEGESLTITRPKGSTKNGKLIVKNKKA